MCSLIIFPVLGFRGSLMALWKTVEGKKEELLSHHVQKKKKVLIIQIDLQICFLPDTLFFSTQKM